MHVFNQISHGLMTALQSADSHEPAEIKTSASNTSAFKSGRMLKRIVSAADRIREPVENRGSRKMCSRRCDIPNATCRASSCAASRHTAAVTGSGAYRSRNHSSERNVPSPSTDSRNEAMAKSGSSTSVLSEACPPAVDKPELPTVSAAPAV